MSIEIDYRSETREIFNYLREERNVSLLHANVLLGSPLPIIQTLYDLDPERLTDEVVIDSIFDGSPGVLTFLAEKYKSSFIATGEDEDMWSILVKEVKNHEEWGKEYNRGEHGIEALYVSRYRRYDEGRCALEEFMEVFPELIAVHLGTYSPIELCFLSHHLDQTKHFASKIVTTPTAAFDLSPWQDCPRRWSQDFEPELDGDCMEALAGVFTKYDAINCRWCFWNREAAEKFIQLLFQSTTTVKQLDFDCSMETQGSVEDILPSIKEEQLTCPLEDITIEFGDCGDCTNYEEPEGPSFLFPFLPHMPKLQKLVIKPISQKSVDWTALQHIVVHGELKILHIDPYTCYEGPHPICTTDIISIFEAARCSQSLKEISVRRTMHELRKDKSQSYKTLQMCMLDILEQNTVLTSVTIEPEADELLSRKINHLTYLNVYGRRGIREETTTLLQFLCMLGDRSEDQQRHEMDENMKMSVLYGLLRERPTIWIQNIPNGKSTGTGTGKRKRKRWEYDATTVDYFFDELTQRYILN